MSNGASTSTRTRVFLAGTLTTTAVLVVGLVGVQPAGAHHGGKAARQQAPTPTQSSPTPAPAQSTSQETVTASLGATGENVRKIENRLREMKYYVGSVDTTYDDDTFQAVTAFQKVQGMDRTGNVTPEVWNRMVTATQPSPLVGGGGERRVEVDVGRQVLFLYEGNNLAEIVAVSTGSEERYCENGSCGDAVTPRGDFKIYRQGFGWEYGPLGGLYNPGYFTGGYAIHGSKSVPNYPASHGCVRIPMSVAEWFHERAPVGTPVYVRN